MGIRERILKKLVAGYKRLKEEKKERPPIPVKIVEAKPLEVVERPEEVKLRGLEIPPIIPKKVKLEKVKRAVERKTLTYPLIPKKPAKGEPIFAYSRIFWDRKAKRYFYQLTEPRLTPKLRSILEKVIDLLKQRIDVDFSKLGKLEAVEYLKKQTNEVISYFGFKMDKTEEEILRYYIERDLIGLGKIEALMRDPQIEDISCDGVGIPVFVFHRDPEISSVITNIVYEDPDELDSFVTRLAQLCGKSISVAKPIVTGTLPDGSRLHTTLATDIARKGSNFTIRKFTEEPMTPVHFLNYGTVDVKILAYLWLAVDYGRSLLIAGGTASGKTSFLNILSLFIRPEKKIISIEDTSEIRLPHPHWVPAVARIPIAVERGEVDLFTLLKESLRQRPDYIIVGEVRGQEAYILFQQIATGHPSMATIHAEDISKLSDRLTTPPISLPPELIGSLDLIIFLLKMRYRGRFVRRVAEVLEMIEFDPETKRPIVNRVFKWNPVTDRFEIVGKSILLEKISRATGIAEKELIEELERRTLILDWMRERGVMDYREVYKVMSSYYSDPRRFLASIMR